MARVGRNDPCPCGSGKKYKHCHWQTEQSLSLAGARAMSFHDLDRALAQRLTRFAAQTLGPGWFDDMLDHNEVDAEAIDDARAQLFGPCSVYETTSDGKTIAELYLATSPRGLELRERAWLLAQSQSWLSVWEVRSVTPGVSVEVRDVFTGEERRVLERGGSRSLAPRDNILARVVDFEGLTVFCGMHGRTLPPREGTVLIDGVRRVWRLGKKPLSPTALRKRVQFGEWVMAWEDMVARHDEALTQMPKLHNTDGDPLLITRDHYAFEPGERASIEAQFSALAELDDDDESEDGSGERSFVFKVDGNAMHKSWDNTVVGRATLSAAGLVLESNSVRRADDLRAKVQTALGASLRHRLREHEDPVALMAAARAQASERAAEPEATTPPELQEALSEFKRRHFESWLDTPVPALGNATPREAAALPRKRADLVLLLKELEHHESRLPVGERFDVATLWAELGVQESDVAKPARAVRRPRVPRSTG